MRIVTPQDPEYNLAKKVLNSRIPSNPAAILYCYNEADIIEAIKLSQKNSKIIRVRSTGHSYEGFSTGDDMIYVIDVSNINSCTLSEDGKFATVGAGAQLYNNVYLPLWNQGRVSIPAGSCPTVGIAGLLSGGGFSFSGRKYGLTCDSVIELRIITADAKVRVVNKEQEPELFWACCGAGNGNFGVISSCTLMCFPATDVSTYHLEWDLTQLDFYTPLRKWFKLLATAPVALMPFFKINKQQGKVQLTSFGQFYGPQDQLEQMITSTLGQLPTVDLEFATYSNIDAIRHWGGIHEDPAPQIYSAHHINQTPDTYFKASSVMIAQIPPESAVKQIEDIFYNQAVNCFLTMDGCQGGISSTKPADYNAYAHRTALSSAQIYANWTEDDIQEEQKNINVVEALREILEPFGGGAYVNYCDVLIPDWLHQYYGSHIQKLQSVKNMYDPLNIFHYSQSITPAFS